MNIFKIFIFSVGILSTSQEMCATKLEEVKDTISALITESAASLLDPNNQKNIVTDIHITSLQPNLHSLSVQELNKLSTYLELKYNNCVVLDNILMTVYDLAEGSKSTSIKNDLNNIKTKKDLKKFLSIDEKDENDAHSNDAVENMMSTIDALYFNPNEKLNLKKLLFEKIKQYGV
ncbi:hypothetical protein [Holospora curviuscula]|uniref:Uncharacterized protein n=1 Tax=Holospora curviuscula TaxID=1082868 RepID=A0A2S5R9A5_9PROT|nr:hypothetical protein [Holospora curviuscula]PPE03909.1 hypothetical protein HCUR_00689 [Holospora curviuscula]